MMQNEIVLSVVGCFIVLTLGVNAFFLKGILEDLNDVKLKLTEWITRAESKEKRITDLEVNQKEIYGRLNKLERK